MKIVIKLLFYPSLFLSAIFADVCTKPIVGTITGDGSLMTSQLIINNELVIDGNDNGEGLYYKIQLPNSGKLILKTGHESSKSDDVHTHGQLLMADCSTLVVPNDTKINSNPRYFKFDSDLATATYYLRVYNKVTISDGYDPNNKGYFRLTHNFTPDVASKGISITKTSSPSSSMNSGSNITYTMTVTNTGSTPTTSAILSDPVPTHLDYVGKIGSADWTCISGDHVVCTYSGGAINVSDLALKYKSNTYSTSHRVASGISTVVAGYADGTTVNDTASRSITIKKVNPSIKVEKTAPSSVLENEEFDFTFKVSNISTNVNDTDVIISGTISDDFDIVSIDYDSSVWEGCNTSDKNYQCKLINDLATSTNKSFKLKVKAVGAPKAVASQNSVIVNANTDPDVGSISDTNSGYPLEIIAQDESIKITKISSDASIVIGHSASYILTVDNDGNMPLTNVVVEDTLPPEVTALSVGIDASWDCGSTNISANYINCKYNSTLNPTDPPKSITINYKGKLVGNPVINIAEVDTAEGAEDNDIATIRVISPTPGAGVVKRVYEGATEITQIGSNKIIKYGIFVDNNGSEINNNITVSDNIDSRYTFESPWYSGTNWACSKVGYSVDCSYSGTLLASEAAPALYIYLRTPFVTVDTPISNTAVMDANASDGTALHDTDSVTINIQAGTLSFDVEKSIVGAITHIKSGKAYTYRLSAYNGSSVEEHNVTIEDTLDPRITDFTVNSNGWNCITAGNKIVCKWPATLLQGNTKSFTIDVNKAPVVSMDTIIINYANGSADIEIAPFSLSSVDDVNITINPPDPQLNILKRSSQDIVLENDTFSYIIEVDNNGVGQENNLILTDIIHSDLNITSVDGGGDWSCSYNNSDKNVTCTMAELNASTFASDINITVKSPSTISANYTIPNSAKVVSSKEITGKNANKSVNLKTSSSALDITLISDNNIYIDNEYNYRANVINHSGVIVSDINISTILPATLTFVSCKTPIVWSCLYDNTKREISWSKDGFGDGSNEDLWFRVKAPSVESNVTLGISMVSDLDGYTRDVNITTPIKPKEARLRYKKAQTDKSLVAVGEDFIYTLQIENYGTQPDTDLNITNLKIEFDLDLNVSYNSHTSTDWSCNYVAPTLTCDLVYLEAGQLSPDINVFVNAINQGQATSTANLTADQLVVAETIIIGVEAKELVDADMSLNIDDSLDPVEGDTNYYYNVSITNHNVVKKAESVVLEINTTSINDYIYVGIDNPSDWNCAKSSTLLTCHLQKDLLPDTTEILNIEGRSPNMVTTVDVNATLYSDFVNDTSPLNNSANEKTNIKITDLTADNKRDFTKVKLQGMQDLNILGDIITIGNQSICQQSAGSCVEPWFAVNDLVTQKYINLDPAHAAGYKNATKAKLTLQTGDKIVWAGLYWMGRIDKNQVGWETLRNNAHKIYLRADSNVSGYIEIQADRAAISIDNNGSNIIVDKFNFINGNNFFDYQGVADVTDYVKLHVEDDYWVGDISSSEGDNLSAGWNLVVIVQDAKIAPTRTLKNITIFDGFQGVWKSSYNANASSYPDEVNQTIFGILTPATGSIESRLVFFGFEGDETLKDFIKVNTILLTDSKNPANDAVNGTISKNGTIVNTRSPALMNTSGIDVDEFDVGDSGQGIIGNSQTSVDISIGSDEDRFFLGMFGFSTSLKDPVCYVQKLYSNDFTSILTQAYIGDEIGIEVMFENIETQTLYDTHAFLQIDDMFEEDNSSFKFKNVAEGSFTPQSSLFNFATVNTTDGNLSEVKTSIGAGASALSGGDFASNEKIFIRYIATINEASDDNLTHNAYSISYSPTVDKKIQVSSCNGDDQNLTIRPNEPKGFQVMHEGIDVTTDNFIDINASKSNETHLYTQVQNINFGVDIVHIKPNSDDGEIEGYTGRVKMELVDMSEYNASIDGSCESLVSISSPVYEAFGGSKPIYKNKTLLYDNAVKSSGYRVTYLVDKYNRELWNNSHYASVIGVDLLAKLDNILKDDPHGDKRCENSCVSDWATCSQCVYKSVIDGGLGKSSCSIDKFSVKPRNINMSANSGNPMIGAKDYNLSLLSGATGYEQNITIGTTGSLDYNLTNPGGCDGSTTGVLNDGNSTEFIAGNAILEGFIYDNIGKLDISYVDSNWTGIDQDTNFSLSNCIIGDSSNIPNADGKVGCDIKASEQFDFIPAEFGSTITSLSNFTGGFTYLSNNVNMSAPFKFEIIALLGDGTTATNFESACYAVDVNYTLSMGGASLADAANPLYFDINNSAPDGNLESGKFKISEGNFTNGKVSSIIGLNAQRMTNNPKNPFKINTNDIGISIDDNGTYGKSGAGFSVDPNNNATFYYGRVHVPDIQTPRNDILVRFNYEVYCKGCNKSIFTVAQGDESPDSVYWYNNNDLHLLSTQGEYKSEISKNGTTLLSGTLKDINVSLGVLSSPHKDRVEFDADSWLLFNKIKVNPTKDSFFIHFTSRTNNWAGKGKIGKSVDHNLSRRSSKKMVW